MPFPKAFYRWRPHPWHGLEIGPCPPQRLHAYIEITPFDTVKYEIDKITGYLLVDRPQLTSSQPPTLYGFVPKTYCGKRVSALSPQSSKGDGDPLDICVLSERPITRSEVIVTCRVVGGLQMVDDGEADDKIIAVLEQDAVWGEANDIHEVPTALVERLRHYFMTYKLKGEGKANIEISQIYGREHAEQVIQASIDDYEEAYGS